MTKEPTALLGRVAAVTLTDEGFDEQRKLQENSDTLQVPDILETHTAGSDHHIHFRINRAAKGGHAYSR